MKDELDTFIFDTLVPLPYRILFLIQLGHLLWYIIVYGCYKFNRMNVLQIINMSYSSHNYSALPGAPDIGEHATVSVADIQENDLLLKGIWSNFRIIALNTAASFTIYKIIQVLFVGEDHHSSLLLFYHLLPLVTILLISYKIFNKSTVDKSVGKLRIFTTMKRILVGNINSADMRTNDILISDSLVSYAKVLNDIGIFVWHYFISDEIPFNNILEFVLLCFPALIRIRQCWNEFVLTGKKECFLNLIKYVIGTSPTFINFLIKFNVMEFAEDDAEGKIQHLQLLHTLNVWWYLTSFISSTYSFIWDVKMDWGFGLFDYLITGSKSNPLRDDSRLIYSNKQVYYIGIFIDFCLRFIWLLKLYTTRDADSGPIISRVGLFLFGYDAFSFGYCLIEVLEIFRRFMWCFFKLESDWFKLNTTTTIEMSSMNK